MKPDVEASVTARLRALRVDPPDDGFMDRLAQRLEQEPVAVSGGRVTRLFGKRRGLILLSAAAVFVSGGALAFLRVSPFAWNVSPPAPAATEERRELGAAPATPRGAERPKPAPIPEPLLPAAEPPAPAQQPAPPVPPPRLPSPIEPRNGAQALPELASPLRAEGLDRREQERPRTIPRLDADLGRDRFERREREHPERPEREARERNRRELESERRREFERSRERGGAERGGAERGGVRPVERGERGGREQSGAERGMDRGAERGFRERRRPE